MKRATVPALCVLVITGLFLAGHLTRPAPAPAPEPIVEAEPVSDDAEPAYSLDGETQSWQPAAGLVIFPYYGPREDSDDPACDPALGEDDAPVPLGVQVIIYTGSDEGCGCEEGEEPSQTDEASSI